MERDISRRGLVATALGILDPSSTPGVESYIDEQGVTVSFKDPRIFADWFSGDGVSLEMSAEPGKVGELPNMIQVSVGAASPNDPTSTYIYPHWDDVWPGLMGSYHSGEFKTGPHRIDIGAELKSKVTSGLKPR